MNSMKHTVSTGVVVATVIGGLFMVLLAVVLAIQWPGIREKYAVRPHAEAIDTSDWLTYRDEELGISFRYPYNLSVKSGVGSPNVLTEGDSRWIAVSSGADPIVTFFATAPNYSPVIGEGTRQFFVGPRVAISGDISPLDELMKKNFFAASSPLLMKFNNFNILSFYYLYAYGTASYRRAYLVPLNHPVYTNLMMTDGEKTTFTNEDGDSQVDFSDSELFEWFYDQERNDKLRSNSLFNRIASTLQLSD